MVLIKKQLAVVSLGLLSSLLPAAPAKKPEMGYPDTDSVRRAAKTDGEFRYAESVPFADWANAARAKLIRQLGVAEKLVDSRVPLAPKLIWTREVPNGTITKLYLQSEKDYVMPVYLCLPKGNGPFPVWICVQGHGTGMHASISVKWQDEKTFKYDGGDRDFALQCLEKGYAALCIEQRAFGEKSTLPSHQPNCSRQGLH
ncbi:MAG: hypothetical protein J5858_08100, partial [Lentisphaeria bacterium]|nr:hypothetical protein [Lentisphaeria bacterium]